MAKTLRTTALAAILGVPLPCGAEELLIKGEAKYLGWKVAEAKFKTCSHKELTIATGRIEHTAEKCDASPGTGPFMTTAHVIAVDEGSSTITIGKDAKKTVKVLFPRDAQEESGLPIGSLKTGDIVTVTSPVEGRATAVRRMDSM